MSNTAASGDAAVVEPHTNSERLLADLHVKFIASLNDRKDSFHYWTSQHLRISGMYWGCSALFLLNRSESVFVADDIIAFTLACQNEDGGFGGNHGQASHMLYTLSALQVLALYRGLDRCNRNAAVAWIAARQKPNGSFEGDEWGEVDTRFPYIALNALQLLGRLDAVDVDKAVAWVLSCQNWDGGFGVSPGAESHAGQIFCCVAALRIANSLDKITNVNRLANWLAFRQLPEGGLNGRPEKKADVCYSWWVMSSLSTLQKLDWIHKEALFEFIFQCQDAEDGGIADKPGNMPDVYHTFFGLCGLSLLGYVPKNNVELGQINPVYALPYEVLEELGVTPERGLNVGRQATKATPPS